MDLQEDIDRGAFGPNAVPLFKHPLRDPHRGFEISGGSLEWAYAAGSLLRRKDLPSRVFLYFGRRRATSSIWRSAFIGHNQLNVTVGCRPEPHAVDGPCASIWTPGQLQESFDAFGFESVEVDGHDVLALYDALKQQV